MAPGISIRRARVIGLPLSRLSSSASSAACFSSRSARRHIRRSRSSGSMFGHEPLSNAARAARTARSTSSASASATSAIWRSVAGSKTAILLLLCASTHWPLTSRDGLRFRNSVILPEGEGCWAMSFGAATAFMVALRVTGARGRTRTPGGQTLHEPNVRSSARQAPRCEFLFAAGRTRLLASVRPRQHGLDRLNRCQFRVARAPGDEAVGAYQHAAVRLDHVCLAQAAGWIFQAALSGTMNVEVDRFLGSGHAGAAAPLIGFGTRKQHEPAAVKIERREALPLPCQGEMRGACSGASVRLAWAHVGRAVVGLFGHDGAGPVYITELDIELAHQGLAPLGAEARIRSQ